MVLRRFTSFDHGSFELDLKFKKCDGKSRLIFISDFSDLD